MWTQILDLFKDSLPVWIVVVILLFLSFVEVSKVKINPLVALVVHIRTAMTRPIIYKLELITTELEGLKGDLDKEKVERAHDAAFSYRSEIINAANELRRGEQFTRSRYDTLIDMHTRYNKLVDENSLPNNVLEYDYEYILERMHEADENGEFM